MKRKIYLALILFLGAFSALADSYKSNNPMSYPYYIMGEQKITGRNTSTLNNIQYKGFSSQTPEGGTVNGIRTEDEKLKYEFNKISTTPHIEIENKELQYWRQLDGGVWMSDAESGNGTSNTRLDKDACFLLILDQSSSLGEDFNTVKQGANVFIDEMYKASSDGNIRIGIICFSTMDDTRFFDITPLTSYSKSRMQNFINYQSNTRKATSMYYSINKGVDMLDEYVNKMNSSNEYENAHIITFTDGLDNTSQIEEAELYAANEVYAYVKDKLKSKKINSKLIDSWVIGVQGVDVQKVQLDLMKSQLQSLATKRSQFIFLDDISDLIGTFSNIARNLTDQWKNLSCTSALNHNGLVCWTLGERPKVKKHMLLGVNVGVGFRVYEKMYKDYFYENAFSAPTVKRKFEPNTEFKMNFGVDFAYPITEKFGLGAYFSSGFGDEYVGVTLGALTTIGNYNEKAAFLGGIGCDIDFGTEVRTSADIRLGVLFRNGLYLMTTMSMGPTPYGNGHYHDHKYTDFAMTFNLGYNFGALFEVK